VPTEPMPQKPMPQEPMSPAPAPVPVSPELLAWARQTFDVQEFLEGVREIEATGGASLESFIAAVEAAARGS
jgi:hypothetical protein